MTNNDSVCFNPLTMSSLFQILFPHCGVSVFLQSNNAMDAFVKAVLCLCACMHAYFDVCTCVDMHMGCVLMYAYVEACLSLPSSILCFEAV